MKITVIGCGRWGTFLAHYLSGKHQVTLWGRQGSPRMRKLLETRQNDYITLGDKVRLEVDLDSSMQSDIIIISVLAQEFGNVCRMLQGYDLTGKKFVLCMKGIESETGKRLSEIAIEHGIPQDNIAVWVGPGHVQSFLAGTPNCMLIDSYNPQLKKELVEAFSSKLIRFYLGNDIIGAELGAAAKNVLGVAAGMLDGMNMSSLKGALMARGAWEVSKLVGAAGGNEMTPYGLSHLGDFEATLFSPFSHNRKWGENFVTHSDFKKNAEGVSNILGILALAKRTGVEMPITETLYDIVYKGEDIIKGFERIFQRTIKEEFAPRSCEERKKANI